MLAGDLLSWYAFSERMLLKDDSGSIFTEQIQEWRIYGHNRESILFYPQICMSGQCFRLDPVSGDTYELIASDRYLRIKVEEGAPSGAADGGEGRKGGAGRTVLYCSSEEYESFWKRYFDLDTSYEEYLAGIDPKDEYLRTAAWFGSGIRILRQDVWEMIITFILSQQNNIPRIKGLIQAVSGKIRTENGDSGRKTV